MTLAALLQKLAGGTVSSPVDRQESVASVPKPPGSDLPVDLASWPEEWQRRFDANVKTLINMFRLDGKEAEKAAELGLRYEYWQRCCRQVSVEAEGGT